MGETIYKHYDRAGLDLEYDNRGKVDNFTYWIDLYPSESQKARKNIECRLDVSYADSPEETLDIFFPTLKQNDKPLPVHVFFHGGYWKALNKSDFSYVANGFTPKGVITVVVNYALIPHVNMSELVEQCRRSLVWIWQNAQTFNADRDQISISGHSAGGHLVGMMVATDWQQRNHNLPRDLIKSACGISGLYDLKPIQLCFLNDDLKLTVQEAIENSPVQQKREKTSNLLLPLGELEGAEYLSQSSSLADAWQSETSKPEVMVLAGHDHFSIVWELNNPSSELATLIHKQMKIV